MRPVLFTFYFLAFLGGCSSKAVSKEAQDVTLYRDGLKSGDCGPIRDPVLRDDCFMATAPQKELRTNPCDAISAQWMKGECFFLLAEREKDASLCKKADRYQDDCALHVLSMSLGKLIPKDATPASLESQPEVFKALTSEIEKSGLKLDDPRPWSAIYRWTLGGSRPFDRSTCGKIQDSTRREACEKTGLATYNDLLNNARDRKLYPCDKVPVGQAPGSVPAAELPPLLQYTPDPDLDALRLSRQDLCP